MSIHIGTFENFLINLIVEINFSIFIIEIIHLNDYQTIKSYHLENTYFPLKLLVIKYLLKYNEFLFVINKNSLDGIIE